MGQRAPTTVTQQADPFVRNRYMNLVNEANILTQGDPLSWYAAPRTAFQGELEQQAQTLAQQGLGAGSVQAGQAADIANRVAGSSPQNVTAPQAGFTAAEFAGNVAPQNVSAPALMAPGDVAAGTVSPTTTFGQVQGGSFLGGPGISAYMNPFQGQVIDAALGDIERSRQIANQQGARSAGASTYGGSRNALIEAETNRAFADQAARTAAQLRSQGFDTAAGLMGADLSRGLQAGLANQQAAISGAGLGLQGQLANQATGLQAALANQAARQRFGEFGAGIGLQAQLANQEAGLTAGLANQATRQGVLSQNAQAQNQLGQFNAGLGLQGMLANQQAGLQANQQALGAAGLLGQLGQDEFGRMAQGVGLLSGLGQTERGVRQLNLDQAYENFLRNQSLPFQELLFRQQMLQGFPGNFSQVTPGGSRGAGFAGGALSGAAIGSSFGPVGAGIGALGGGLLGLF